MAYTIKNTRGDTLKTVTDGTLDSTLPIKLYGKNYLGYGEGLQNNLISILENFTKDTEPSAPLKGQLWYDNANLDLKVYNGTSFVQAVKTVANLTAGNISVTSNISVTNINFSTAMTGPQLVSNIASGTAPLIVTSTTQVPNLNVAVAGNLINGNSNVIVNANSYVTVSVAGTAEVINVATTGVTITGNITANTINSGLMQNGNSNVTIAANSAVSIAANGAVRMTVAANGNVGIGTASPARMLHVNGDAVLGGSPAAQYSNITLSGDVAVQSAAPLLNFVNAAGSTRFGYLYHTGTAGTLYLLNQEAGAVRFGTNNTERMRIDSSGNVGIANTAPTHTLSVTGTMNISGNANIGSTLGVTGNANVGNLGTSGSITALNITANNTSASTALIARSNYTTTPASADAGIVVSLLNNTYLAGASFGAADLRFLDIGIGPGPQTYLRSAGANGLAIYSGMTVTGSILPSANATYSLGNTTNRWSNIWGLASSAQYADLAEKYRSDADYEPGTVLEIGGDHEITVCNTPFSNRVFGCVSTDPAYLMNDSDKEGIWLPVVLTGRAPICVAGPVNKGDRLVSAGNGAAMAASTSGSSYQTEIGRALEDKTTEETGLIEAYISTK